MDSIELIIGCIVMAVIVFLVMTLAYLALAIMAAHYEIEEEERKKRHHEIKISEED